MCLRDLCGILIYDLLLRNLGRGMCENESNLDLFLRASVAEDILDV